VLRSLTVRFFACAALLGTPSGCGVLEPDEKNELTLYIAPSTADCMGVGPQQCLLVKERPDGEWSNFYAPIVGFTYEPGYTYAILVEWRRVRNPPADGSSREYRLVRIIARDAAPAA
jgi:hypothetical protein